MGIAYRHETRTRNAAINNILGQEKLENEDASGYQTRVNTMLGNIANLDPMEKIGLSNAASKPIYAQEQVEREKLQQDVTNAYKDASLLNQQDQITETGRHNVAMESKTTPKGFGMVSDDLGNFYQYSKDTGEYSMVQQAGAGGVNPDHVSLKPVVSRDENGIETTKYVPFNKMNGQPINGADAGGIKYPVISNGDKSYRDDMPVIDNNIANLEAMINNPKYASSFGQFDNAVDSTARWMGYQGDGTEKNAEINALSSNLLAGFGKAQMAGVLTDQDMKIIKQQIPSSSDSPATARKKMAFVKELMAVRNKSWSERLNASNPNWLQQNNEPVQEQVIPKTALEDLVPLGDGLYKMPDGTVIRKKAK